MNDIPEAPISDAELDAVDRRALAEAIAKSLSDPKPDIAHDVVSAEIGAELEGLKRQVAAPPAA